MSAGIAPIRTDGSDIQNRISASAVGGTGFANVLQSKMADVTFSAHAKSRLTSRNISITPQIRSKLNSAVASAKEKGAKDSLVVLRDLAFIVNVPNRVVVTAMDGESMKHSVFTKIDSTILVE